MPARIFAASGDCNGRSTCKRHAGDGRCRELRDEDRLRVAFNSYDLASAGLRLPKLRELADRPKLKLQEFDFQTREAVTEYIRRQKQITPVVKGWWLTTSARSRRTTATPVAP